MLSSPLASTSGSDASIALAVVIIAGLIALAVVWQVLAIAREAAGRREDRPGSGA